jgi:hypothetical protein
MRAYVGEKLVWFPTKQMHQTTISHHLGIIFCALAWSFVPTYGVLYLGMEFVPRY